MATYDFWAFNFNTFLQTQIYQISRAQFGGRRENTQYFLTLLYWLWILPQFHACWIMSFQLNRPWCARVWARPWTSLCRHLIPVNAYMLQSKLFPVRAQCKLSTFCLDNGIAQFPIHGPKRGNEDFRVQTRNKKKKTLSTLNSFKKYLDLEKHQNNIPYTTTHVWYRRLSCHY